jgi:hypothetical protein
MNKYKTIICGCTKNSSSYIYQQLLKLVKIGELFAKYHIIIYENDSNDNTCEILEKFKSEQSYFTFIHETDVVKKYIKYRNIDNRVQILSHGRNQILNEINQKYKTYDFMIMIDLDNVLDKFKTESISNIFKYDINSWDVLTANCVNKYYDIWALRISSNIWKPEIHGRIWHKPINHDCWNEIVDNIHPKNCVKNYQKIIPINNQLIETDSSFGGLGIYKISKIQNCKYDSIYYNTHFNYIHGQCEHVGFHKDIKNNNGKIFICPSLLVNCPTEHLIQ